LADFRALGGPGLVGPTVGEKGAVPAALAIAAPLGLDGGALVFSGIDGVDVVGWLVLVFLETEREFAIGAGHRSSPRLFLCGLGVTSGRGFWERRGMAVVSLLYRGIRFLSDRFRRGSLELLLSGSCFGLLGVVFSLDLLDPCFLRAELEKPFFPPASFAATGEVGCLC